MIEPGKHAVIVGQNGSGKSQQLINLALANKQKVVVLDTKLDDDFLFLAVGNEVLQVVESYREMIDLLNSGQFHYLIVRPQTFELDNPTALDNYLVVLSKCRNLSVFIDEAYSFHKSGRAGPGYTAILTRGRSRKLSLIVCTQRPCWISVFTFSESTTIYAYFLSVERDRKILYDYIGEQNFDELAEFCYYKYDVKSKSVIQCVPVKLFKRELFTKRLSSKSIFSVLFNR